MSYPVIIGRRWGKTAAAHAAQVRALEDETLMVIHQRDNLRIEREAWMTKALEERAAAMAAREEVREWKSNHDTQVALKRRLSNKYGAIMRNKPKARWRRAKKRAKRSVTKITHKLGRVS